MKSFVFIGAAISGNQGANLMFQMASKATRSYFPDSSIALLSHYPNEDSDRSGSGKIEILNGRPFSVFPKLFLLAIVWRFFPFFRATLLSSSKELKSISSSTAAFDISGISFSSGRFGPLVYNIAVLLPFFILRIPVIKLSQAIGPFSDSFTKIAAKYCLSRCERVYARGEITKGYVEGLSPKINLFTSPDLGYLATNEFDGRATKNGLMVVIPSNVVKKKHDSTFGSGSYLKTMADFISESQKIREVIILAFAMRENGGSHNNDGPLADELELASGCSQIRAKDLEEMLGLIKDAEIVVTGRFHGMIASLAAGTPAVVTTWGHKYEEALINRPLIVEFLKDVEMTSNGIMNAVEVATNQRNLKDASSVTDLSHWSRVELQTIFKDIEEGRLGN